MNLKVVQANKQVGVCELQHLMLHHYVGTFVKLSM